MLVEGGRVEGPGPYFTPAVLTDITPEMRVYKEEAFGPLAMIYRARDADEAVELANSSAYGLNGTVLSEDVEAAMAVASGLDTGAVGINGRKAAPAAVPFGGTKRSGVGRKLGPARTSKAYTVVLKSRANQRLRVRDPLDAQFLEFADEFQMKARQIAGDIAEGRKRRQIAH